MSIEPRFDTFTEIAISRKIDELITTEVVAEAFTTYKAETGKTPHRGTLRLILRRFARKLITAPEDKIK